jgi:glycosyltransferase involved in cell wall biosynthesis
MLLCYLDVRLSLIFTVNPRVILMPAINPLPHADIAMALRDRAEVPSAVGPFFQPLEIAVLIPCYNEEAAIANVVGDFRRSLPGATIYVYDNNSSDRTAAVARAAGAIVRRERLQGKGNVVRRMFGDIDADVFVLVDGDATYEAGSAAAMVGLLLAEHLDMVNGARISESRQAYRRGHRLGNVALSSLVGRIFGAGLSDILSGYKVMSRRFVKSMPLLSSGFEIETELAVHALSLRMPIAELETKYSERPTGSSSKLSTYRDGIRIVRTIMHLVKEEQPLSFFSWLSLLLFLASMALGAPVVLTFLETGLVPRLPTALLAMGVMLLAFLSLACGLILATVTRGRQETKRLAYLALGALPPPALDG